MAWKCKECGGEIKAYVRGRFCGTSQIDDDGTTVDVEDIQIQDCDRDEYFCAECQCSSYDLEDIAEWED